MLENPSISQWVYNALKRVSKISDVVDVRVEQKHRSLFRYDLGSRFLYFSGQSIFGSAGECDIRD